MRTKLTSLLVLTALLTGCAVSTTNTVVTLPSIKTGSSQETVKDTSNLPTTVAVLPFVNETESEFAFDVVRQTMYNHFASKNYRMLHWKDIDQRLALAGIDSAEALKQQRPAQLAELLGVDGLIYGDITHYKKTFAGIYAQVAVGVALDFVKPDGTKIWQVKDVKRSHAGGLSTSPVGLILNALISAKHVYGDMNLYRAADELGRELATKLPEPSRLNQRNKPVITDLVHSGVGQHLKYGDSIDIAMLGDPGLTAAAVIDDIVIDLKEGAPGEYTGSLVITPLQNINGVVLSGKLQDDFAQTTSWISPYGLVNIDNIAPVAITGLNATPKDGAVMLTWTSSGESDLNNYRISKAESETGQYTEQLNSKNSEILLTNMKNFETRYVSVSAVDKAGNLSTATAFAIAAAPDARFATAKLMDTELPGVIHGSYKMTRAASPYILRGHSRIATDGLVLIEPGVVIKVAATGKLSVLGELHTFGTPLGSDDEMILVTSLNNQDFNEFLILQGNQSVSLSGLHINGAGIPLQINAGAPLLQGSKFLDSKFNCLTISGSAKPVIRNNILAGARTSGVVISDQAQPIFEENQFVDNQPFHIQNSSTFEINAKGNRWQPEASNASILGKVKY